MYDLIVIGAGPGGYTAAIKAAKSGLKTAIVEADKAGGTCLNSGCIPTKYLVTEMHKYLDTIKRLDQGLYSGSISLNYSAIRDNMCQNIAQMSENIGMLLKGNSVEILHGTAEFVDCSHIRIKETGCIVETSNIIVATGARPIELDVNYLCEAGKKRVFTTDNVFAQMDNLPKSVVIAGAGAVGLELAFVFSGFGVKVTVLEQQKHVLGNFDHDVSNEIIKMLKKSNIRIVFEASIDEVFADDKNVTLFNNEEEELAVGDVLICAVGRIPNTEELNLEAVGVIVKNGKIQVDEFMKTHCPNIYAIGDVNGIKSLAYVATSQAENVVADICGKDNCKNTQIIPQCIFSDTEIAFVGLSEKDAKEKNIDVRSSKYLMSGNGRSRVDGNGGFIKIISDGRTEEILGGACVCQNASEIITYLTMAIDRKMTISDFAKTVFPHPTYVESLTDAALAIRNDSVYLL